MLQTSGIGASRLAPVHHAVSGVGCFFTAQRSLTTSLCLASHCPTMRPISSVHHLNLNLESLWR